MNNWRKDTLAWRIHWEKISMNNKPAQRTQIDGKQDEYSLLTGIATGDAGLTRQEQKEEADVNWILSRFGPNFPRHPAVYGERNYDMDLQRAHVAIDEAHQAWDQLSPALKEKFPDWQTYLAAVETGRIKLTIDEIENPEKPSKKDDTSNEGVT